MTRLPHGHSLQGLGTPGLRSTSFVFGGFAVKDREIHR